MPDWREAPCDDCEDGLVRCISCGETPAYGDGKLCEECGDDERDC